MFFDIDSSIVFIAVILIGLHDSRYICGFVVKHVVLKQKRSLSSSFDVCCT